MRRFLVRRKTSNASTPTPAERATRPPRKGIYQNSKLSLFKTTTKKEKTVPFSQKLARLSKGALGSKFRTGICNLGDSSQSPKPRKRKSDSTSVMRKTPACKRRATKNSNLHHNTSTPDTAKLVTKRPVLVQTMLDLGQRNAGVQACPMCGMMFTRGSPQDEKWHSEFCQSFKAKRVNLSLKKLAKERGVHLFPVSRPGRLPGGSTVAVIESTTSKYVGSKLFQLHRIMTTILGLASDRRLLEGNVYQQPSNTRHFLLVGSKGLVIGCLVAQTIRRAFVARIAKQADRADDTAPSTTEQPLFISRSDVVAADIGVSLVRPL